MTSEIKIDIPPGLAKQVERDAETLKSALLNLEEAWNFMTPLSREALGTVRLRLGPGEDYDDAVERLGAQLSEAQEMISRLRAELDAARRAGTWTTGYVAGCQKVLSGVGRGFKYAGIRVDLKQLEDACERRSLYVHDIGVTIAEAIAEKQATLQDTLNHLTLERDEARASGAWSEGHAVGRGKVAQGVSRGFQAAGIPLDVDVLRTGSIYQITVAVLDALRGRGVEE